MTHSLAVHSQERLFVVKTTGSGNASGIVAFLEDIVTSAHWELGMSVLVDHRDLNIGHLLPSEVNAVSNYFQSISADLGHGKLALVMNKDVDFGIARAWEAITSDHVDMDIFVFREIEKALTWLGFERSGLVL